MRTVLQAVSLGALLLAFPVLGATPDWLITSKAKLGLFTSEVRSKNVYVDTNGGVVTLFGKVATEEQKSSAERLVSQMEGVRSVTNRLQVGALPEARREVRDRGLKKEVQQALANEPSLQNRGLFVKSVDKGVVTLAGEARNFSDPLRAVAVIDRVPGVQRVRSEVKNPTGPTDEDHLFLRGAADDRLWAPGEARAVPPVEPRGAASDVRITGAVKLGLFSSPKTFPADLDVDTENGVVTLFGVVPSDEVKAAVGLEASRIPGVTGVQNQLEVVSAGPKETVAVNDEDLARAVKRSLAEYPELGGVTTAVKNGVVQLSGYVTSSWGELDAVRLTRQVKGVRGITNLLKVEPTGVPRQPGT